MDNEKTLRDVLPDEFMHEFSDTPAAKHLDKRVVEEIEEWDIRYPFTHKFIYVWWVLEDGYAVGWNENPGKGWSFPVKRLTNWKKVYEKWVKK